MQGPNQEFEGEIEEDNQEAKRGKGILIDFRYWLKPPFPSITLDKEALAQISRNYGHFWCFWKFLCKKQGFLPCAPRHWRNA